MKLLITSVFFILILINQGVCQPFVYKDVPDYLKKNVIPTEQEINNVILNYPKAVDAVNYLPKNYVIDGSVDYTKQIQNAINNNSQIILPNFPVLVNSKGLTLKSNSIVIFRKNSKILLRPTIENNYQILRVYNVNNIKIFFPNVIGDKDKHLSNKGEFGMGISIRGSNNVKIYKAQISSCWGDGLYIDDYSKKILIEGIHVDNNRRNGISIVYGSDIIVNNLLASNTFGTSPMAGIDIEPDNNTQVVNNITLNYPVTFNNGNRGILLALMNLPGPSKREVIINVNNHTDYFSKMGMAYYPGKNQKKWGNFSGRILINNPNWKNSLNTPFFIPNTELSNNLEILLNTNNGVDRNTMNKIKNITNIHSKIYIK
ncbi:right-handed parallel beta-helix repeat-containing protein [Sphingobacterium sp. HJSM2_6]|uniref:right-handed parallel beta-helix repeat-containing protein n=1 Tax=Sphingobacterium sp. HJSM2_6 TaxID=3366264 RepID=UPI003BEACBE0